MTFDPVLILWTQIGEAKVEDWFRWIIAEACSTFSGIRNECQNTRRILGLAAISRYVWGMVNWLFLGFSQFTKMSINLFDCDDGFLAVISWMSVCQSFSSRDTHSFESALFQKYCFHSADSQYQHFQSHFLTW